jgi:hypothetical protein
LKRIKGSSRTVFVFDKFVIKIPNTKEYRLFLSGILANLQEKLFSRMCREDLAKVMFCDKLGLFLIMEKADMNYVKYNWKYFKDFIKNKYVNDAMKDFMLSDLKYDNWGYIKGRLIKIDYGN